MEAMIAAHGLKLFVREQGQGYPLVLINGIGTDCEMWGSAERILAASSRTIVFDSPGTGRSETPLLPRSIPALARIICALLDELGHERVDLVGFSFGGALAQQLAKDAPDRVRRLGLISTFCGWGATGGDPGALRRVVADGRTVRNPLGSSYQLWALAGWSSLPWLSKVIAPTLVVAGTHDEFVPVTNAAQLARHLPNSSLHLLPGEQHLCMFDPAGAGSRLLADFFSSETLDACEAWTVGCRTDDFLGEAA
jgi:pimeloyl-ACP methyl ester carboxylesterase